MVSALGAERSRRKTGNPEVDDDADVSAVEWKLEEDDVVDVVEGVTRNVALATSTGDDDEDESKRRELRRQNRTLPSLMMI